MFNAGNLLDSLLKGGLASSSQDRVRRGSGGIGLDFGRAGGRGRQDQSERSSSFGGGGGSSAFSGLNKNAGGLALIALIAGTAFKKYQDYQASQAQNAPSQTNAPAPTQAEAPPPAAPAPEAAVPESDADVVVRAMISAAKADGAIDGKEMQTIMGRLEEAGASDEERNYVLTEMSKPLDLDSLVASVTSPKQAAEIYAASLMAINVDTPAEQDYMRRLGEGLKLPPEVTQSLHDQVGAPKA